jgi:hypothetical protein
MSGAVTSRNDGPPESGPKVQIDTLEQAAFWIGVLHRRSVVDIQEINRLSDRIRRLEQPWWKRPRRAK